MKKKISGPITIDRPMVLIPVEEYEGLLREAGDIPTPQLSKEIQQARARFKKGNVIPWNLVKHGLK